MTILKDIYKSIFGEDFGPVWQQFAIERNGTYYVKTGEDVVKLLYRDFTLIFDSYTHYNVVGGNSYESDYTRGRVEFISPDNFKLRITKQGLFENIGKLFGAQDVKVGEEKFDKRFMVKSNDEPKTFLFFSNNSITKLLLELNTIRLNITDEEEPFSEIPTQGYFMLHYVINDKVTQIDQLNKLYDLFVIIIDSLIKISSIKPETK